MDPLYFEAFCFQNTAVNEAIVQLENTDTTTLGPQEKPFGVSDSVDNEVPWNVQENKTQHSLVQQKIGLHKPFSLGSATNSIYLY